MKINTILRYICLGGIFLVPFIPLIVPNSFFFPFITGKNFAFRIIVEIILGAWVILAVTDKAYRPRKSWMLWILAAFVGVIALADAFGVYPYKSFWSNSERMEGFITLAHAFAYFLVISSVLTTEKLWNWFWNTTIGVNLILVVYGLLQLVGKLTTHQGDRLDATLGNSAYLAVYMLFHIFLVLFIIASRHYTFFTLGTRQSLRSKMVIGGIIVVLQGIVLFNTGTRGSILGLLAGLLLTALLILIFDKTNKKMRLASGAVIAAVVVLIVGFIVVKDAQFVQNNKVLKRFASISLTEKTTQSRFILWKEMGLEGFKERPILGWGQENFNYVFNKYYDPRLYANEQWFDRTHNVIFDWLIAGGILGLAGYLAFFGSIIWFIWKGKDKENDLSVIEKSILTGFLAAYFVHNFFVFDNLISYILYFSLAGYVYSRRTYMTAHRAHEYVHNQVVAPVALVATAFIVYFLNVPAIKANTTLINAISPQSNITKNLELFKQALSYKTFVDPEIREQIFSITDQIVVAAQQNPQAASAVQQFLTLVDEESKKQIARTPNDARYYILPGAVFTHASQFDRGIELLKKGVELSPNKQSTMYELAYAYLSNNQTEEAYKILKAAYEAEKSNEFAKTMYIAGAIYAKLENKDPVVQEMLKSMSPEALANNDQIIRAYYVTGQYKKVLDAWKLKVAKDPTNAELHVNLAAAYLMAKDKAGAIAELRKAIELNPEFKEQGEQYIKGIQDGTITQ